MKKTCYSHLLLVLVVFLFGCSANISVPHKPVSFSPDQALLTVYLTSSGVAEVVKEIQIEELAIDVAGAWISLDLQHTSANFAQLKGQQQLLGVSAAPLGEHQRFRLRVRGAESDQVSDHILLLDKDLQLEKGQSKCLFLDWRMETEKPSFLALQPRFTVRAQGDVLASDLLYVACGAINTVYLVRLDNSQVVASFSTPGPLGSIRIHPSQPRMYILSRGQRAIFVYDCLNARLVDRFNLSAAIEPADMELSADGHSAYVSDPAAGAVFKIDLSSGELLAQFRFGVRTGRLAVDDAASLLAVSLPASDQVYFLDAHSLKTVRVIPVGSEPAGLIFFANSLYVAEKRDASVGVFSLNSGQQRAKISTGPGPESFLLIDRDTAYVSQGKGSYLSVLSAGQNVSFRQIGPFVAPAEMALSARKGRIYVTSRQKNTVRVVDQESEKGLAEISVGEIANSLVVFE